VKGKPFTAVRLRIALAGGGTGGHLFPALALAEEFKARDKDCEILFIGSAVGIEKDVIPKYGYALKFIDVEGLKGKGLQNKLSAGLKAAKAVFAAKKILKQFRPHGVIGTGGYSSGPVVLAARLLGIKTAILEQNTIPGLTNRLLGRLVNRIYVAFEQTKNKFPGGRVILTGNPVRREILDSRGTAHRARLTVLVFGGSQGAKAINTAFLDALEYLADIRDNIRIIHQTGDADYTTVKETYERKGIKADVYRFIENIAEAYSQADIVICRAGATSIAEITAMGIASILIPYPFAANNHQETNARCLADKGAAIMLKQGEIIGDALAVLIKRFYKSPDELKKIRANAEAFGMPDATTETVENLTKLIRGRV
jgi:UDP-N-acetylglucosamine--N-acetylmuramyl-(pentapeptide) pyrophosphoryl-undecaprenol N-acetylglucosamine transferase